MVGLYTSWLATVARLAMIYSTTALFLELLMLTSAEAATEEAYVTVARCRIQCLRKFVPESRPYDDNSCRDINNYRSNYNRDCADCWYLCQTFITSPSLMASACGENDSLCGSSCQTACNFIKNKPKASAIQGEWKFQEQVSAKADTLEVEIDWKPPILVSGILDSVQPSAIKLSPLVYILFFRNSDRPEDGWALVDEMVATAIRIKSDFVPPSPEFLLLAVSENGVIAQVEFKAETFISGDTPDPEGEEYNELQRSNKSGWYIQSAKAVAANITLTKVLVREASGSYWTQKADVRFRNLNSVAPDTLHVFLLRWFMIDCKHAYDFVPNCFLPREDYGTSQPVKENQEASYVIQNLNFNSIYLLMIFLEDHGVKAEVVFKTEPCRKPDKLKLTRCLDNVKDLPSVPIIPNKEPSYEPEVLQLSLNISSMTNQPNSDRVLVNITWSSLLNHSVDTYVVTTYLEGQSFMVAQDETRRPFIILSLEPYTQYYVKVHAVIKSQWEGLPATEIFDHILVNTSDVNSPVYQRLHGAGLKNEEMDQVDGIIIGITCFFIVFVLVVLATILYKKRKSFKDIIVTKATVAKSNSYKSNVGGKSDYSNQLNVFSDEWELDPLKLKFSTLLGQGAFGKVVTGYYDDQKVAIKLVREGAPLSYKEDLVAEINLMKRIGSHPNIVCIIGACTLSEPISLVMEYVPYGNLQNFLKKCRLDGDLRKSSDRPTEITYTVVQESGCMESGVVTPADMLSFARQVAMAMEYLTEKKYVHRDLAARNVLIDYNKVVKVCDFGLSRDIFNDNHYKKLTNGKLPLKWMAIESLRDRIFTTQSDVWSFGILLWEIVTMGASPYPNVALADLYYVLSNGYRMDRPSNCSQELYTIMRSCWEEEPLERPNFTQLRLLLEDLLTEDRDYLVLEDIDVPLSNSDNSSSPSPLHSSEGGPLSTSGLAGASGGLRACPVSSTATTTTSNPAKIIKKASPRRDNMRINVCIHQKSTDRLIRPSESDSSPSSS